MSDNKFIQPLSFIRGQRSLTGFTLAELLMSVWIISIIVAAAASLFFVLGSASASTDNLSQVYNKVRYTTVRINELVRNCKLICRNASSNVVLWLADYNGDNQINPGEIVSFETGSSGDRINLITYLPNEEYDNASMSLGIVKTGLFKQWLATRGFQSSTVTIINNCSYIYFTTDVSPPFAKKLNIFIGILQGGISRDYQMTSALRCNTDYMLGSTGQTLLSSDDDM